MGYFGGVRPQILGLQSIGKLNCEIGALAKLAGGLDVLIARLAHLIESLEQPVHVLRQELLAESRIGARPRELVLGDQVAPCLGL